MTEIKSNKVNINEELKKNVKVNWVRAFILGGKLQNSNNPKDIKRYEAVEEILVAALNEKKNSKNSLEDSKEFLVTEEQAELFRD